MAEYFNRAFDTMIKAISSEKQSQITDKFKYVISGCQPETIYYCTEKYVNGELDYLTPGSRGLGRMTDYIPRFGAHFRNSISQLSRDEMEQLKLLLYDLVLSGYLTYVLFFEKNPISIQGVQSDELYKKWLPGIYISDNVPPKLREVLASLSDNAYNNLYCFFDKYGIKSGLFSRGKGDLLLSYYPIAGVGLRLIQERLNINSVAK